MTTDTVRYLLQDILDLKLNGDHRANKKLALKLAKESRVRVNGKIQVTSGFVLGNMLLLIKDGSKVEIQKLVLLDSQTCESLQIKNIKRVAEPLI